MEKSRAIELLKLAVPIKALTQQECSDFVEAVNMGMDALEQPTSPDTIDRKAALDALDKRFDNIPMEQTAEILMLRKDLRELPTIQPQSTTGQPNDGVRSTARSTDLIDRQQTLDALIGAVKKVGILDADDIKAVFDMLPTIQPEKTQPPQQGTTSDLISRMETAEHLRRVLDATVPVSDYDEGYVDGVEFGISTVSTMPTIQPEQHEGTWVYGEDSTADCVDGYRCSQCGFFVPWDYNHKLIDYINDYAYCPNCGADMRGEKDG